MKIKSIRLDLFLSMLKIGAFTFGGGYAMISLFREEFCQKKKWIEESEFLDLVAIAESTPGPIAINSATYIGYKMAGVGGSAVATLGMCIPSLVIIYLISLFFDAFLSLSVVASAFRGIQAAVVYLILSAGIKMLRGIDRNIVSSAILILTLAAMIAFSLLSVSFSSVFYILIGGFVGFVVFLIKKVRGGEKK